MRLHYMVLSCLVLRICYYLLRKRFVRTGLVLWVAKGALLRDQTKRFIKPDPRTVSHRNRMYFVEKNFKRATCFVRNRNVDKLSNISTLKTNYTIRGDVAVI